MENRREVRRKEKQVTDRGWMDEILERAQMLQLGMAGEDGWPYIVPMGYGYKDNVIYLHGASQGKKNELLAANPKVCFQVSLDVELVRKADGSNFTMKYRSVTGFGKVTTLTNLDEKNEALKILMRHYDGPHTDLGMGHEKVWVARLDIESVTGKNSIYPQP